MTKKLNDPPPPVTKEIENCVKLPIYALAVVLPNLTLATPFFTPAQSAFLRIYFTTIQSCHTPFPLKAFFIHALLSHHATTRTVLSVFASVATPCIFFMNVFLFCVRACVRACAA